mgnify:FL=1
MEIKEVACRVQDAMNLLIKRDRFLLQQKASEWAIAHRLAVYMEMQFPEWNIDCEYNRVGWGISPKYLNDSRVRPDIVVHHRGYVSRVHNLLIIELKKSPKKLDVLKARAYTEQPTSSRQFQYQYGLALAVLGESRPRWFSNGKEMEP